MAVPNRRHPGDSIPFNNNSNRNNDNNNNNTCYVCLIHYSEISETIAQPNNTLNICQLFPINRRLILFYFFDEECEEDNE